MNPELKPRKFAFKFEKNNKDGSKTLIDPSTLDSKDFSQYTISLLTLIDTIVEKDDCREADLELTRIYSKWNKRKD